MSKAEVGIVCVVVATLVGAAAALFYAVGVV